MRKFMSFLCVVLFLSFITVPVSHAGGFETKIVFVPGMSASELRDAVISSYKIRYKIRDKSLPAEFNFIMDKAMAKIDKCVFDINTLTRDGWEIKTSRRAWQDFNDDGEPNYYEWGTEYTLQKKKSWWSW